ncbi:MAG TPA: MFS transporter [Pseudacidobacterium sp.]|jgi:predicted MFS family arabinose efflux permease|nr:MFS transporter [Pseudacidobacterium sp.]
MTELLLDSAPQNQKTASFWRNPSAWLRQKNLGRGYWIFFSAAFFFDAGFAVYFFLFNLYLLDRGFNEQAMGWIGGAMTLGSLVGTLPAGELSRRFGVRPLLIALFLTAPLTNAMRAIWVWEPAQIGLAFLTGMAMSSWGVCFLPAVARLSTERNRASAFSLIFSVSVGTSMLGGIVCGYLRQWLEMAGIMMQPVEVKRLILLASCGIALLGLFPVLRLRVPSPSQDEEAQHFLKERRRWLDAWRLDAFLARFLPLMALWSAILAAFTPFANVYLTRDLHISMTKIGLVFSTVQVVQLCMGLLTPVIFRTLGLLNGIVATQITAAVMLALLSSTVNEKLAIGLYLIFSAAQWMSSPGLYSLLMDKTPDRDRSTAAAMTMFSNSLAGSLATAGAGVLFTRFGYPHVLSGLAVAALSIALLFRVFISPSLRHFVSE